MARLHRLSSVLQTPDLPIAAKATLAWLRLRKVVVKKSQAHAIPVSKGNVFLDLASPPDTGTFLSIFCERLYQTDYHNATVIDVGAHKGYFLAYAICQGASRVMAFEPERANFDHLVRTAKSLHSQGIQVYPEAISDTDGELQFYVMEDSDAHSLHRPDGSESVRIQIVRATAFEGVIRRARDGGTNRLIVKMNAEGAEYDIVMNTSLDSLCMIDELFLAVHDPEETGPLVDRLEACGLNLLPEVRRHGHMRFCRAV